MSTEPRTVQVGILTVRTLEIDEPDWCAGHPAVDSDEARAQYKTDITHWGPEHVITAPNGDSLLRVVLGHSPYSELASTAIELYVDASDVWRTDPQTVATIAPLSL